MKIKETKEAIQTIKKIYAEELPPEAIKKYYNGSDYLEQLYPKDKTKIVGDWILENFELAVFLDIDRLKEFTQYASKELKSLLFYSNLRHFGENGEETEKSKELEMLEYAIERFSLPSLIIEENKNV